MYTKSVAPHVIFLVQSASTTMHELKSAVRKLAAVRCRTIQPYELLKYAENPIRSTLHALIQVWKASRVAIDWRDRITISLQGERRAYCLQQSYAVTVPGKVAHIVLARLQPVGLLNARLDYNNLASPRAAPQLIHMWTDLKWPSTLNCRLVVYGMHSYKFQVGVV